MQIWIWRVRTSWSSMTRHVSTSNLHLTSQVWRASRPSTSQVIPAGTRDGITAPLTLFTFRSWRVTCWGLCRNHFGAWTMHRHLETVGEVLEIDSNKLELQESWSYRSSGLKHISGGLGVLDCTYLSDSKPAILAGPEPDDSSARPQSVWVRNVDRHARINYVCICAFGQIMAIQDRFWHRKQEVFKLPTPPNSKPFYCATLVLFGSCAHKILTITVAGVATLFQLLHRHVAAGALLTKWNRIKRLGKTWPRDLTSVASPCTFQIPSSRCWPRPYTNQELISL